MGEYPEKRPDVPPLESFTFNTRAGKETAKDLDLKISALEQRIQAIVQKVEVGGMPLLQHILGLSRDQRELTILGNALIRVAELVPDLEELQRRKAIIDLAMSDPQWLAATFADFSGEVEDMVAESEEREP